MARRQSAILLPLLAAAAVVTAAPARADVLSVHAAQQTLARGAVAWDVRSAADYSRGHLPGAVRAEWGGELTLTALEEAVSQAGIDLSREVVVYGSAGEPRARRLYEVLQRVAPGQVHWLVGGVQEWTLAGQPLSQVPAVRAPVPQRLVVLRDDDDAAARELRMAADALRRSRTWLPESVALMQARAD